MSDVRPISPGRSDGIASFDGRTSKAAPAFGLRRLRAGGDDALRDFALAAGFFVADMRPPRPVPGFGAVATFRGETLAPLRVLLGDRSVQVCTVRTVRARAAGTSASSRSRSTAA